MREIQFVVSGSAEEFADDSQWGFCAGSIRIGRDDSDFDVDVGILKL
jgi:hypothetical protein